MSGDTAERQSLSRVAVIIPALNEAASLRELLPLLIDQRPGQIIVADNGSTDETAAVANGAGATVVHEPRRGYGAACYAGMGCLPDRADVVAFIDADLSDDPNMLPAVVQPIIEGSADLVLGSREPGLREPGSMTLPQRFGNALAVRLIRWGWGHRYSDLGPLRAIRRSSLDAIAMQDRAYGWTVEMQIRALELGLRIASVPVPYRRRKDHTRSKISGTVRGTLLAGYWILTTCARLWWTRGRRLNR